VQYKSLLSAALPRLAADFTAYPSFLPQAVVTLNDDGSVSTSFTTKRNYTESLFNLRDNLPQLTEVVDLMRYISSNDTLANDLLVDAAGVRLPTETPTTFFSFTVWPFLWSYLSQVVSLDVLDETLFEDLFGDIEIFLQSTTVPMIFEALIIGLHAEFDRLDIAENIWLRKRNVEDIQRVSKPYEEFDPVANATRFNDYYLAIRVMTGKHVPVDVGVPMSIAGSVISALRLLKTDRVLLGPDRYYPELRAGHLGMHSQSPVMDNVFGDYTLGSTEVDELKSLFENCRASNDKRWQLAMRRLNQTYDRKLDEDRVVDCWIGLETLLLSDGNSELSYKSSMRLARFIGDTSAERKELQNLTKKSYDYRSKIVHGKTPLPEDLPEVTTKSLALLRRVLVRWLDTNFSHELSIIDESMLQ